jgi:uncharacterized membrane protein YoaK (UPF0700 family)
VFHHEGQHRTEHHNQLLAGYLALVAGLVNSAGFILIGTFTSHVTGNVGRLADNLALGHGSAAALAATMVGAFFVGAFVCSMALESNVLARRPAVYAVLLLGEATLLGSFWALARHVGPHEARLADSIALLLCAAMGLQNSLVTRLSGAVVRTTHLTGVVTDLGIEAARWFRFWRARLGERAGLRLVLGSTTPAMPHAPKAILLATILLAFVSGSAIGAVLALSLHHAAILLPAVLLVAGGLYAALGGPDLVEEGSRK